MDADLQEMIDGGMADAIASWDDVVTVQGLDEPLHGVQSNTTVEQQVMLSGMGFEAKRTFTLLVNDKSVMTKIKFGMIATDAQGQAARFIHFHVDPHSVLLFFELNK